MTFVMLGDLHSAEHGADNCDLIAAVREAEPDAVLCVGDMLVGKSYARIPETVRVMSALNQIAPLFTVNGNHCTQLREFYPRLYRRYMRGLKNAGVRVLNNRDMVFEIAGNPVHLYGIELSRELYRKFRIPFMPSDEVEQLAGRCDPEVFSVLLAHNPQFARRYMKWGADLSVCGHFHGGVMRLFGNRVLVSPYGIPFPRYGYGKYTAGGKTVIVTSGLGEHTIPVRIHNPMEIAVIRVRRGKP